MLSVKKKLRSSGGHKNPSYVISIPLDWCQRLGFVKNSIVYLTLDNEKIILSKDLSVTINPENKKREDTVNLARELESRFE